MLADGAGAGTGSDGPDGPNLLRRLRSGATRTMASVTPFDRLGRFVVRRAWWVVGAWVVLLLVALPFAPQVPGPLSAGGFILDDLESARAKALLGTELGIPPSALVIVFSSPTLEAGTPAFETAAAGAVRDVPTAPHVARVVSHLLSPGQVSADGHTAYDIVFLDLPPDDSPDALPILRERLHDAPGLTVELAGGPAFYGDVQSVSEADLRRSEVISLPLAALALLFVFGSLVAAGVPLIVGGAAVVVALAAIFVVASVMPMSIFVLNLATLLGLGLGVDYSLLMTSRFREELARRPDGPDRVGEAVRITVATAGRAVFFSGLTVLLGLLGLVLFEFMILRSVGIAGAIVVGLAVLSALTLLPALLAILGRADRPVRGPPGRRRRDHRRAVGPARPAGHAPPGRACSSRRSPSCSCWARRSCTSGSTRRTRRSCRRTCRRAPPSTGSTANSARASSRRSCSPSGRPDRPPMPGEPGGAVRLLAAARGGPAGQPRRQPRRRRPAADARPVPAPLPRPERPARPLRPDRPGRHDQGRPDGVHALHAVRPEPRRGHGRWSPTCAGRRIGDGGRWRHRPA